MHMRDANQDFSAIAGHRYIHGILSHGVGGRSDNTVVATCTDLLMMYSVIEHYSTNLGHHFADLLVHQGTFADLGAIFTGPYITHLIRGMRLILHTQVMHVVCNTTSIRMATLFAMGLVEKHGDKFALLQHSVMGERIVGPFPNLSLILRRWHRLSFTYGKFRVKSDPFDKDLKRPLMYLDNCRWT